MKEQLVMFGGDKKNGGGVPGKAVIHRVRWYSEDKHNETWLTIIAITGDHGKSYFIGMTGWVEKEKHWKQRVWTSQPEKIKTT